MRSLLTAGLMVVGFLALVLGVSIWGESKSAVHEIEALICILIGATGIGLSMVSSSLDDLVKLKRLERQAPPVPPPVRQPADLASTLDTLEKS